MSDRVVFTSGSAERIAKVVRTVEAGARGGSYNPSSPRFEEHRFLLGGFTGNWGTETFKVVTLENSTNTLSVYNWCNPATGMPASDTTTERSVIIGRVRGTWSAVELQLQANNTCVTEIGGLDLTTLGGWVSDEIQLLGHNESACLQWYSITTCATATA